MIKKQHFTIPGAKGRGMLADITFDSRHPNAPLVIFAHGFKGFKDWGSHNLVAHYFVEQGFRFLKFNFSHNGTTAAHPSELVDMLAFADNTLTMELEELKDVINFACSGPAAPPAPWVYLIGHSMGGGLSIIKAVEDRRIKKLVSMSAICNFHNLWGKDIEKQWRLQGFTYVVNKRTGQELPMKVTILEDLDKHPVRLDIIAHAERVSQPWLIAHGEADPTVPFSCAEALKAANPTAELLGIPGPDHTFGSSHPYPDAGLPPHLLEFCSGVVDFLKK
jgi:pimeloyl-ACP methyl ester carboxylesterase